MIRILFFLLFSTFSHLFTEPIALTIRFNPAFCPKTCASVLERYFAEIPYLESSEVNLPAGEVRVSFKEGKPFDYPALRRAMQMGGVGISWIEIQATGTINKQGERYLLETKTASFELLAPVSPQRGEYTPTGSKSAHKLSEAQKKELDGFIEEKKEAALSGRLFFPDRGAPYSILMTSMQEKEDQDGE